ncbi:hypothetical protein EB837_13405 [Kluyvera ascorbata]|uniref:Uncharacterized protein n=1 Tax=Kluyvera ascorbata TaxID=51288 RepID=A0A3N2S1S8_9ENTR|nr:hypothetical protein [Kluyvera ascorbata]ROU13468.1 hypothetical protein EB837_13405 [Kluyvera ascorbata]
MAEGLRMFYARHKDDKSLRIPVSEIRPEGREDLICEYCDARIEWVKPHKRNGKNISAFLRLKKHVAHNPQCQNIVKMAINALVARSRNIEDGKNIIDDDGSNFIFRMHVLTEASETAGKARRAFDEESDPDKKTVKRIRYQKTERRLSDYFNTATGVAKIRAKIEESIDKQSLSELVKIDYNGKKISWSDFFYDEERYPILFKKSPKIDHPVAILITVKNEKKHLKNQGGDFYGLNGEVCIIENDDKTKDYFSPSLTCHSSDIFDNLLPQDEILVVGKVKPSTRPWKEDITYKNIGINIVNKKQISHIKD